MSGGKDSTALLIHALDVGAVGVRCVFADTGHEHPQTIAYLDYLESALGVRIERLRQDFSADMERKRRYINTKWREQGVDAAIVEGALAALRPTGVPFLDLCLVKGMFPTRMRRFCTDELKVRPFEEQVLMPALAAKEDIVSWVGVRADESRARASLSPREWVDPGYWMERPILAWTVEDVWAAHRRAGVEPNPLYKQGCKRVGCMPCIMVGKDELGAIAARWPDEIARVAEWERIVTQASKSGLASMFHVVDGHGSNITEVARWAMTSRGGRQLSLEKWAAAQSPASCSSIYGLCE
jgi:3'-phosphoadenosine 5'-phosphosulfate sulfotransferase (PAPS reductase)/FAD synthetase